MASATVESVVPLTRRTRSGERLRRPARIEQEIASVITRPVSYLRARALATPENKDPLSSECLVYLIRQDLRRGSRRLAEDLTPILLHRCEASLRGSIRGFSPTTAREVREDVLGKLALSLLDQGDEADFLEVRFGLALKRLRIDTCRRYRRHDQRHIQLEDTGPSDGDELPAIDRLRPDRARQEDRLLIRQALASLAAPERDVLVLHRLAGIPLRTQAKARPDLVGLLGCSERTLRNRLRRAELRLQAFRETPE